MERLLLVILLSACMLQTGSASYSPDSYNLDTHCGDTVIVDRSVRIRMTSLGWLDWDVNCLVTLRPKNGDRLVARFTRYIIDSTTSITSIFTDDCPRLAFLLSGQTGNQLGRYGYCNTLRPRDQYDLGSSGQYGYRTGPYTLSWKRPRVDLLVTEVTDKKNGQCPDGFFDCNRRNYCIDEDLTCNSYDDCGNDDDEDIGDCGLSTGMIIGIVCGALALIVLVGVGIFCFMKYK